MHLHLTAAEIFDLVQATPMEGLADMSANQGCMLCAERIRRAALLLSSLKENYFFSAEKTTFPLLNATDDEIIAHFSEKSLDDDKKIHRPWPRIAFAAAAAMAASIILIINFFHSSIFFRGKTAAIPAGGIVTVEHRGLFFGRWESAASLVSMNEKITMRDTRSFSAYRGLTMSAEKSSVFSFSDKGEKFGARLETGRFFISFQNGRESQWEILLPNAYRIQVTGTKILLDTGMEKSSVFVIEGAAALRKPDASEIQLQAGREYIITPGGVALDEKRGSDLIKLYINIFPELEGLDILQDRPQPGTKTSPIQQKVFKPTTVVETNDGKKLIGIFRSLGATIEIITADGKKNLIPAASVKSISPYRE